MTFVVDASLALAWFLPDEVNPVADDILRRVAHGGAYVPDLFWHEMRNVLVTSCRRKRLSRDEARLSLSRLAQLPLVTRTISDSVAVFDLAEHHQLTAYDAAYLALAIDLTLPLVTVDKKLMGAATHQGVPLLR
ncbi:type II toxin-antitoxin system VapC family toxin [Rhizobium sp.]|jgi:predicted nucleic acid-binding protein|uniref:type II toxin-antitoxin system VapC family toxin n=1 Tax=Rhizobium sp. TaxID=391 RepID=UPI0013AFD3CE